MSWRFRPRDRRKKTQLLPGAPREDAPRNDATPFVLEHGRSVFEFYGDAANARASQAFDELMLQLSTSDGESGASAELVADAES